MEQKVTDQEELHKSMHFIQERIKTLSEIRNNLGRKDSARHLSIAITALEDAELRIERASFTLLTEK